MTIVGTLKLEFEGSSIRLLETGTKVTAVARLGGKGTPLEAVAVFVTCSFKWMCYLIIH